MDAKPLKDQANPATGAVAVVVTAPDAAVAAALARTLVEEGLAACVNCLPGVRSTYRWQGRVEEATEVLLVVKTTAAAWPRLEARIRALHPYEVPEIVALPIAAGLAAYLDWIEDSVTAHD